MDTLRKLFADAQVCMKRIAEKLSGNQILAEQECLETIQFINEIQQEQKRCIKILEENGITEECQSIDWLEEQMDFLRRKQEQEKRVCELRGMAAEFLAIQTPLEDYKAELERVKAPLASCKDEMLLQMEEKGELAPYQEFIRCVKAEQPDMELVHSLADVFGRQLAFALLYHELELAEQASVKQEPDEQRKEQAAELSVTGKTMSSLLEPIHPIRKRSITTRMLSGLSTEIRGLLLMLRQFAVLNMETAAELNTVGYDMKPLDRMLYEKQMDAFFGVLLEKGLAAGYQTEENGVLYCLTECGYKLTALKEAEGSLGPQGKRYRKFSVSPGNHKVLGTEQMDGDILRSVFRKNQDIGHYLTCVWENREQLHLSREMPREIISSVYWEKDHYTVKVPVKEGAVLCTVYHAGQLYPGTGAVLFLDAVPPKEPFGQADGPVFFCDGEDCYYWEEGWVSMTRMGKTGKKKAVKAQKEEEKKTAAKALIEEKKKIAAKALMQEKKKTAPDELKEEEEQTREKAQIEDEEKTASKALKEEDEKTAGKTQEEEERTASKAREETEERTALKVLEESEEKTTSKVLEEGGEKTTSKVLEESGEKTASKAQKEDEKKTAAKRRKTEKKKTAAAKEPEEMEAAAQIAGTLELEIKNAEAMQPNGAQGLDAQKSARLLLEEPELIRTEPLLRLTIQLIAENRIAEAAVLAETLAKAPNADRKTESFYRVFRQCVQVPGSVYNYSSEVIGEQQSMLPEEDLELRGLQQTMILATLLWAMAFPSMPYDHNLYNNVKMAVSVDESQPVQELIALLSEDLKAVSFQNDGLGFSPVVISSLADNGERERQIKELCKKAVQLRPAPTSTVGITGLETCLKQMVGPASAIGTVLLWMGKNDQEKLEEAKEILEKELGGDFLNSDSRLEEYIDRCWNELYRSDPRVKIKRLDNDTTARKQCKKALADRLKLIGNWFGIVRSERESRFGQYRENYARVLNQVRTSLNSLIEMPLSAAGQTLYERAKRNILHITAQKMLAALGGLSADHGGEFYYSLCLTPELMLGENGENVVISALYGVPGMEPWNYVLRAIAAEPETPREILEQIDNYQAPRWYRNYGNEALLLAYTGAEQPDRTQGIHNAQRDAEQAIKTFQSDTRLSRAYGKIQESTMETAFSILDLIKQFFFRTHNYASFKNFLSQLEALLAREIEEQFVQYEKRIQELESDALYAGAPMLKVIRQALAKRNFNSVDSYINQLQGGMRELPASEQGLEQKEDFLLQFQKCEEGYYKECQSLRHRSENPARWGEQALESMGREYQHWTSPNEKKKGCTWLSNWIMRKDNKNNADKVRNLLTGLGFRVREAVRAEDVKPMAMYELFQVSAEKTSSGLKDYPHPIYKFGTELSDPMYVVCLYGCKGESTLIHVMTSELQLNGPTIVLMDGSLTVYGRRLVAKKFKADTSGQSPFLLIDRVLLLYLASLNEGDRQNAMLHCTLPYTFEVLYGNGSGAVPEEMFIGRSGEMNDLRNRQGPDLVYGGRQLGKTALLNRASKTIHDPKNRDYSFCVEVKDVGSGALLEKMNRQLLKLKLLEEPCTSLKEMCETLQEAYEDGKIRELRVFVDEVDQMFEEFRQNDYEALRPFIVMRDETKHHVKFVFAGTHNVAATKNVEEKNSNLLHMGTPLCIEPLSLNDAMKLIRIPMSYLGFEIGDSQIELILSNTNSYPGLIHIFCNALIQSVCRDYETYYDINKPWENPPYRISDEQMRAVFKEKDIRKEIGTRVMATIKLNPKYHVISCLLANMLYEDRENERSRLYGHSAEELLDYNRRELQLPLLMTMTEKNLKALLNEMVKMGILWKNSETEQFRFRQQDFLNYIGNHEQVLEFLLSEGMEVGKQ